MPDAALSRLTPTDDLPDGSSLRLVKIRLALALAAAAILPVAATQAAIRAVDAAGPGVEPSTLLALLAIGALLVGLVVRMAGRVLEPAVELDASRGRLRDAYEEVREFALVDGLTGLGNHRAFQEAFEGEISRAQRYRQDLSLVLLDLDEFKLVNDAQGHAVGDSLLAEVGRLIRGHVRRSDRAFRIGGDEFALILPQTTADGAQLLARRLLAAGLELRPESAYQRPISFSAGVSSFPAQTRDREQLRTFADSALYRGKRSGRTTVTLADPALDGEQVDEQRRAVLSAAIAKELAQRSLRAVYQPIIHLESGRVIGFEGLTRTAPDSAFSNPGALFAAAEVSGRLVELDVACLATVLAGAAEIPEPTLVTVNLSPRTLEAPEFGASRLLAMVASSRIAPSRVILEVTERDIISDVPRVVAVLERCRAAGVRVAVDDVGAGNAGLRLLSQFRFDVVKIDLSLVQAGAGKETVRAVLGSLVDLAGRLGALVVAEGIETPGQLAMARELGIDAGQGYLLGRPGKRVDIERVDIDTLLRPSANPYVALGLAPPDQAAGWPVMQVPTAVP